MTVLCVCCYIRGVSGHVVLQYSVPRIRVMVNFPGREFR